MIIWSAIQWVFMAMVCQVAYSELMEMINPVCDPVEVKAQ